VSEKYLFIASSPDNPNKPESGLGFHTREQAQKHADRMNVLLENFEDDSWDKEFWKSKPAQWKVYEL
jgi:hypothetical protein